MSPVVTRASPALRPTVSRSRKSGAPIRRPSSLDIVSLPLFSDRHVAGHRIGFCHRAAKKNAGV
jgi:hypothetical protein